MVLFSVLAICGPSKDTCDAIVEDIVNAYEGSLQPKGRTCNIIRFMTATSTPDANDVLRTASVDDFDAGGLTEWATSRRDAWKSETKFVQYSYHEAKKRWAMEHGKNLLLSREHRQAAQTWLAMLDDILWERAFDNKSQGYKQADAVVGRQVLSEANIIIGTLDSMTKSEELDAARVDTLIVDECVQATLPGIAVPLNSFRHTFTCVVFGGNHDRHTSYHASAQANEASLYTSNCVFGDLCEPGNYRSFKSDKPVMTAADLGRMFAGRRG